MRITKRFISLLLLVSMLMSILPYAMVNADSGFDLKRAKKLYEQQIEKEKAENENFADAYMIDVYNNNEPVLIIISGTYEAFMYSDIYTIKNYELAKINGSNLGLYLHEGSNGYDCLYYAKDINNKVYCIKQSYNISKDWENPVFTTEIVYSNTIFYYTGDEKHILYDYEVIDRWNQKTDTNKERIIIYETAYDKNGNSYNPHLINNTWSNKEPDNSLSVFGLETLCTYRNKYLYQSFV